MVQTAYYTLANGNKPKSTTPQITGTVPAYLQAQLANYQAGLARLEGSSSSSSSSSATTAESPGQVALSLFT
jgi:cytochrome c553